MRDFRAGRDINVGGDVHIYDQSQGKLLIHCSNEELVEERAHREGVLKRERKHKLKLLAISLLISGVLLSGLALWLYVNGRESLSSITLSFGSLIVGVASFDAYRRPNNFEQRQIAALNEIRHILRERGYE